MEIEMKAKVNIDHIEKLLKYFDKESLYLEKKDEYFSFDGIAPKKPKNIIRIRKEQQVNATKALESVGGLTAENIKCVLIGYIDPFAENGGADKFQTFLTVKAKNTSPDGVEVNEETEGQLFEGSEEAFRKSMKVTHFEPYFTKLKKSFSFYVKNKDEDKNKYVMHAELVSVNGVMYLEIESVVELEVEDSNVLDGEDLLKVKGSRDQIMWFFDKELGITEFDGRSWADIMRGEA